MLFEGVHLSCEQKFIGPMIPLPFWPEILNRAWLPHNKRQGCFLLATIEVKRLRGPWDIFNVCTGTCIFYGPGKRTCCQPVACSGCWCISLRAFPFVQLNLAAETLSAAHANGYSLLTHNSQLLWSLNTKKAKPIKQITHYLANQAIHPASQNIVVSVQYETEKQMLKYLSSFCSDKILPALQRAEGSISGSCKVLFKNWKVHVNKVKVLLFLKTALGFSLW